MYKLENIMIGFRCVRGTCELRVTSSISSGCRMSFIPNHLSLLVKCWSHLMILLKGWKIIFNAQGYPLFLSAALSQIRIPLQGILSSLFCFLIEVVILTQLLILQGYISYTHCLLSRMYGYKPCEFLMTLKG